MVENQNSRFDMPAPSVQDAYPTMSVTLGELVEGGYVDPSKPDWRWDAYNDEQYERVWHKIIQHYYTREIGVLPPRNWQREFIRKMNEIMPKYKPVYKMLDEGANIFTVSDSYAKTRMVNSDFPATQLKSDTQDYASTATDNQSENVTQGDWMQKMGDLKDYNDVDLAIVNDMNTMFTSLYTSATSFM